MNSERLLTVTGQKWFTEKFVLVLVFAQGAGLYLGSRQLYRQRFIVK